MKNAVSWIDWDKLDKLGCLFMRHLKVFGRLFYKKYDTIHKDFKYCRSGVWVAQNEDPCPTKKCGKTGCFNYGNPNKKIYNFVILISKDVSFSDFKNQKKKEG